MHRFDISSNPLINNMLRAFRDADWRVGEPVRGAGVYFTVEAARTLLSGQVRCKLHPEKIEAAANEFSSSSRPIGEVCP